jgi:predicted transcriptional regulator
LIGFIDLLLKDKDGNIIVLDHKSASLKFKKNGEVSKSDAQHFSPI